MCPYVIATLRERPGRLTLLLALLMTACNHHYPAVFEGTSDGLREIRDAWLRSGRSQDFSLSGWGDGRNMEFGTNMFFIYTNTISITGAVHRCCFAARRRDRDWPKGALAITESGLVVWIRDRDGKVFIAPDSLGADP